MACEGICKYNANAWTCEEVNAWNKHLHKMINDGKKWERWNGHGTRTYFINPFYGVWRRWVFWENEVHHRIKESKIDFNPKAMSPIFHKIQGSWMFEWLRLYHQIIQINKRSKNNLHDPKVHHANLSQNPSILDGCLNERAHHWILHMK